MLSKISEENSLLKFQNRDLSKQIQNILKNQIDSQFGSRPAAVASEETKVMGLLSSMVMPFTPYVSNDLFVSSGKMITEGTSSTMDPTDIAVYTKEHVDSMTLTPDDVISSHLVTYNDIEALQIKNAQLLLVIRKLAAEQVQSHLVTLLPFIRANPIQFITA
jgi:hypothetical protein